MFERFNEPARRSLFFAREEAADLGSAFIETEHVLLGIRREEHAVTSRVFDRDRLSFAAIRREVEARTSRRAPVASSGEVPFSEEAQRVFVFAAQEAERLLHSHIGVEHLLLGLFREERGLAAIILKEHGLQLAQVRDRIVEAISPSSPKPIGFPFGHLPSGAPRLVRISPSRRAHHEGPVATSRPHEVSADGFTLKELIAWAYRVDAQLFDLPASLDDHARYDLRLRLPNRLSWPALDRLIQDGVAGTSRLLSRTRRNRSTCSC
jgi:hypothetical protein